MKKGVLCVFVIVLMCFNVICFGDHTQTQAKTDTITVKNQNELDDALKKSAQNSSAIKSVIIKSNQILEIKKGDYSSTELVIDSSKANVVNYGTWKSISITKAVKFSENAAGNHICSSGKKVLIDIRKLSDGADIELTGNKAESTIRVFGKASAVTSTGKSSTVVIRVDGVLDDIVINDKSELILRGNPLGTVNVALNSEGTYFRGFAKADVSVSVDSEVRFREGSEGSTVRTTEEDAWAKVVNLSRSSVTICDEDGSRNLKSGEKDDIFGIAESASAGSNTAAENEKVLNGVSIPGVYDVVDDHIIFGMYEQDGNTENGAEPIEWEVLGKDENGILVISKNILDCQPYNTKNEDVTWETCSLRKWLNGSFYDDAFSGDEKLRITEAKIENGDNGRYGSKGGAPTKDRVFCLGVNDLLKYYNLNQYYEDCVYGYCEKLISAPTAFAKNKGVYSYAITKLNYEGTFKDYGYSSGCIGIGGGRWWLRTPGLKNSDACIVGSCGNAEAFYNSVVYGTEIGVRPVICLDPSEASGSEVLEEEDEDLPEDEDLEEDDEE